MPSCGPSMDKMRECPAERATDLSLSDDALREIALRAAAKPDRDVALPAAKLLLLLERLAVADAIAAKLRAKVKAEQDNALLYMRQRVHAVDRNDKMVGKYRRLVEACDRMTEEVQTTIAGDAFTRRLSTKNWRYLWDAMDGMRRKIEELARE